MRIETGHPTCLRLRAFGAAIAFVVFVLAVGSAAAQMTPQMAPLPSGSAAPGQLQHQQTGDPVPPPLAPPAAQQAEPAPPGSFRPGFLDTFGRWIEGSISDINAGISSA